MFSMNRFRKVHCWRQGLLFSNLLCLRLASIALSLLPVVASIELFLFLPGLHFRLSLFISHAQPYLSWGGGCRGGLQSWRRHHFNSAPLIWCPMLPCFQVSHMLQRATSTLWCGWARWPAKVKALRILVSPRSGCSAPGGVEGGCTSRW